MKKAIIIIISALIVLAGTFAVLYFFTDALNFLKPASDNFSIQMEKVLGTEKSLSYSEYEESIEPLKKDGSYTIDFNMKANVNVPSSYIDNSTQKLLNSSTVNVKTSYDSNDKTKSLDLTLQENNKDVIKAETVLEDDKISIKSDDIYDKFLTLDMSEYEKFCKENEIELTEENKETFEVLSKLLSNTNEQDYGNFMYDLLYVSKKDYEDLQKTYNNILVESIDEDNYSTKKNQKITVGDKDNVKTTAYSVTLNGKDAYKMLHKLIETMKNDDTFKRLVLEKYDIYKNYYKSYAEIYNIDDDLEFPDLSKDELNSSFDELLESLENSKDDFSSLKKAVRITIYSNSKNEPVKVELELLKNKDSESGSIIFTEEIEKGKNTYVIDIAKLNKALGNDTSDYDDDYFSYYSNSSSRLSNIVNNISQLKIVDEYEESKESRKGTLVISEKTTDSKSFEKLLNVDYEILNNDYEQTIKLSASSPSFKSVSLNLESSITGLNSDKQEFKFSLSGKFSSYSVSVDLDGTISSDANITKLTESNSTQVFDLSKDEFNSLSEEVVNNAANNLPSKLSKYGIEVTKEDILKLLPEKTPVDTEEEANAEEGEANTPDSGNAENEESAA